MVDASLTKGLEEFLKLVEYIQTHYKNYDAALSIITLPHTKSFSRYEDGGVRTCVIVRMQKLGHLPCYIIEVGRADGWLISTLIVNTLQSEFAEMPAFEGFVQRLLQNLVNNNGHWDREYFKKESIYIFDTAKYMAKQPLVRWVDRIVDKL